MVEAFFNGTMGAARRNPHTGLWESRYLARRSDVAVIRSLRDGLQRELAIRSLILHEEACLRRDRPTYPDLPRFVSCRPVQQQQETSR